MRHFLGNQDITANSIRLFVDESAENKYTHFEGKASICAFDVVVSRVGILNKLLFKIQKRDRIRQYLCELADVSELWKYEKKKR